jgi:hypothetical protein
MKPIKKPISLKNAYYSLLATATVWLFSSGCEATNALEKLNTHTTSLSNLVNGSLGSVVIISGTLIGAALAIAKGNIMTCIGIFIIGILLGWHMENVAGMFAARG